jgi:hypothetical protein
MSADSHRLCCSSGIRKVSGNQRQSEAISPGTPRGSERSS